MIMIKRTGEDYDNDKEDRKKNTDYDKEDRKGQSL